MKRILCILIMLSSFLAQGFTQSFTVKDNRMFVTIDKKVSPGALNDFIRQYDLTPAGLQGYIFKGLKDSLTKEGWKVELENATKIIISKSFDAFTEINDPADRIRITSKEPPADVQFPSVSNTIQIGYNRLRDRPDFSVNDSLQTFILPGYSDAKNVMLAGSFNSWSPESLPMRKTENGWATSIKLKPGKYWYKFIVNGDWIPDPANRLNENDGMGNTNSVYYVTNYKFQLPGYTSAKKVILSGSFNNWKTNDIEMRRTDNAWELPVYLADGTHTYRFIVDGRWIVDPANKEKYPNEFGEFNSVVRMGTPRVFKLTGYGRANRVFLAGSFNKWREDEIEMHRTADGWEVAYTLAPGNYEYHFKVDGKRISDPSNPPIDPKSENSMLLLDPNHEFRLKGFGNAKKVLISGDFNNWSETTSMQKDGDDWILKVHLSPGKHLYKFIIDGKWLIDPANKLWEQNEFGTGNSVIWIGQ